MAWFTWEHLTQVLFFLHFFPANNNETEITTTSVRPDDVGVFGRVSFWTAQGDNPTEPEDFAQTEVLRVEDGAGLCCHGLRHALVSGRGGGSNGRIRYGQRYILTPPYNISPFTELTGRYLCVFVTRYSMWTAGCSRPSQLYTSIQYCSVKMSLNSVYPASCMELTL